MDIKYFEEEIYKNRPNRLKEGFVKNNFPEFYEFITDKFIGDTFLEKLYIFYKGISKCKCGNKNKFISFKTGFRKHCSIKCSSNDESTRDRYKKSCLSKYGVENISKNTEIKKKKEETCIKNYGVKSYFLTQELKDIIYEKYGTDNVFKNEEIKKKISDSNIKKYGNKVSILNTQIKEKSKKTLIDKYGVDSYSKTDSFKLMMKNYNDEKYKQSLDDSEYEIIHRNRYINTLKHIKCGETFDIQTQLIRKRNNSKSEICLVCNPFQPSYKESELFTWISEIHPNVIHHFRIKKYEIDIYLPDLKIGFEYNGLYWHSELNKEKNYHQEKTKYFKENGIQIYHIWEDDWKYKQDIVKSIILNKISKTPNRIGARKCKVVEVSDKISKDFLNKNHLQGFCVSKYRLGLVYEGNIVSLITLGKKRNGKSSNKEFELLRFVSLINHNIVGGFSKLISHFIKKYKPNRIVTYSDTSISNGDLYTKAGFTYIYSTKPNYWYFLKDRRFNRFSFRKSNLIKEGFDIKKTEKEIMFERGYNRIYDCGSNFYEINLNI